VISLVSEDGNRLHPIAVHHPGQEAAELIDELIERVTLEELRAARGPLVTIAQPFGSRSILAVPLVGRSATLGAIVCAKGSDEALNGDDQELVCDVAGVLAMAVSSEFAVDGSGSSPAGDPSQRSSAGLTRREREILGHLARGYTNKEIADRLVLSVRTVEWHRARIQWKLQVSTRAELITAARALGLLEV
jgi:two-component system response regulator NreC